MLCDGCNIHFGDTAEFCPVCKEPSGVVSPVKSLHIPQPPVGHGPGTELKRLLAWFSSPSPDCNCDWHADLMDQWGVDQCRENIDTIVGWIIAEAAKRNLSIGAITEVAASSLVKIAIRIAERKETEVKATPLIVERCFLINLDRRQDRLKEWFEQLPNPWPFPQPERIAAIDGKRVPSPPQWRSGSGAWGCYRSHALILEKCLTEGIESFVVFEDDAGFGEDFTDRFHEYAAELPNDWGLAYLGGQHLFTRKNPPIRISENVYRPYNVNRTHAFMVRGRAAIKTLYRHLHWSDWKQGQHVDHHLGRLVQRRYVQARGVKCGKETVSAYTPKTWLAGQLPSRSNICGKKWERTRFFNDAEKAGHSGEPFFAVLGPHRSGSSCVAMVLHHLGVHLGRHIGGYESTGGGEAKGLATICESAMPFPKLDPVQSHDVITDRLRSWTTIRKGEANRKNTVSAGKYPHLCRLVDHLYDALGDSLRIICCDRPIESSIKSLQSRSEKHAGQWFSASEEDCETLQRGLIDHRERFINEHPDVPVHRVDFAELIKSPETAIANLVEYLGIAPSPEQVKAAINHVQPQLQKH